jgi:hypothetical protein
MIFGQTFSPFRSCADVIYKLCKLYNIQEKPWMWHKPEITVRAFFYGLSDDQIVKQLEGYCQTGTFTCTVTRNADLLLSAYQDIADCPVEDFEETAEMQDETFEERVIKSLDTLPELSKTPVVSAPVKAKDNKDDTPVVEVYVMEQNNDLQDLKNMLMAELAEIRNKDNYMTDGKLDKDKAELFFKRAETVNSIAGNITQIHNADINSKRLQLDVFKTATDRGLNVQLKGNIMGLEIK